MNSFSSCLSGYEIHVPFQMKKILQSGFNLNSIFLHFLYYIVFYIVFLQFAKVQDYSIDLSEVKYPEIKSDFHMGNPGPKGKKIVVNSLYLTKGDKPVLPVMGEFHYSRYDNRYWEETLRKMKASGIDIVSAYVVGIFSNGKGIGYSFAFFSVMTLAGFFFFRKFLFETTNFTLEEIEMRNKQNKNQNSKKQI